MGRAKTLGAFNSPSEFRAHQLSNAKRALFLCSASGKQNTRVAVFLLTIRELRELEDRAEGAVASTTTGSLVIAIRLPNASAKVLQKSTFCWSSLATSVFCLFCYYMSHSIFAQIIGISASGISIHNRLSISEVGAEVCIYFSVSAFY